MSAGYSARVHDFLQVDRLSLVQSLCTDQLRSFRINESQQLRAWDSSIQILMDTLRVLPEAQQWRLILEYPMLRLGHRIDALLITPRGTLVLEFKIGADRIQMTDRRQVEDYALDLQDFHSGSRGYPIVPILVASSTQTAPPQWELWPGMTTRPFDTSTATLCSFLHELWTRMPIPKLALDVDAWEHAPYRPVPGIVDAACTLYERHGVADIRSARADTTNLRTTTEAIQSAITQARSQNRHIVLFITGIPGAGKTLCGLNAMFSSGRDHPSSFLTGNPSLVHVLREALARDAALEAPSKHHDKERSTKALIQALPFVRDLYIANGQTPSDRIVVIDEAQRAWSKGHAIRKSQNRKVPLTDSEPGHLLEIMGRHPDWAVLVCLIGNGQEIHNGEGGLAEWGGALQAQPKWLPIASPWTTTAQDPRQRLPFLSNMITLDALHLSTPMRNLRNDAATAWVDALMADRVEEARDIAATHGPLPFSLTRSLADLRAHLRHEARGNRRAGLIASSGAKRLRAEGLGSEVPHMDASAVAHWFLDTWPEDIRASNALEQVATEFSCQGLELDHVGLCWGGDLIRARSWRVRNFKGTDWQSTHSLEAISNRINTYRVLLTRSRYQTVIWVPPGDITDRTRNPAELNAVAAHLASCGVTPPPTLSPRLPTPQNLLL